LQFAPIAVWGLNFIFGRAIACCRNLLFLQKVAPNSHSPTGCRTFLSFYFLAGVACDKKCAEHTLKNLYLSWEFVPHIAPALKELFGERITDVLPALQSIFWEGPNPSGPVKEALDKLTDVRQRPIAVSHIGNPACYFF
jgi:hypothetical protein